MISSVAPALLSASTTLASGVGSIIRDSPDIPTDALERARLELIERRACGRYIARTTKGRGFGLSAQAVSDAIAAGYRVSNGTYDSDGAFGTHFWIDRKEQQGENWCKQTIPTANSTVISRMRSCRRWWSRIG
jgi:hypothetical protein